MPNVPSKMRWRGASFLTKDAMSRVQAAGGGPWLVMYRVAESSLPVSQPMIVGSSLRAMPVYRLTCWNAGQGSLALGGLRGG